MPLSPSPVNGTHLVAPVVAPGPSVLTPGPTLMLNERGGPVPPQAILKALKEVHPALSLRFMPDLDRSHWRVTWEWPETDPRWARVKAQEIDRESAWDGIGYLPLDCPLEQAADYCRKALKAYPIQEIARLADRVHQWNNETVPAQAVNAAITEGLEDFARDQRQVNPKRTSVIPERILRGFRRQ